jgi:hypothetical protein
MRLPSKRSAATGGALRTKVSVDRLHAELRSDVGRSGRKTLQFHHDPAGHVPASRSGASRTRTGDLLGAIQALSQLSYSPAVGPV